MRADLELASALLSAAEDALAGSDLAIAEAAVRTFRDHIAGLPDHRIGLALMLASNYYRAEDMNHARVWALRALADGPGPAPFSLLGEIAAACSKYEEATRWYEAACALSDIPSHYMLTLSAGRHERLAELKNTVSPVLPAGSLPSRYLIVVACRNVELWITRCLESIATQRRPFQCIVIDDASTDGTSQMIERFMLRQPQRRFIHRRNALRWWSLRNITEAVAELAQPGDVVTIVDGDDWLAHDRVLERLDTEYAAGAWATYGSFITETGQPNWMPPYTRDVVQRGAYRQQPWSVSHLKTFRSELVRLLRIEDLQDESGFFRTAGDVALMIPLLELAAERVRHISDVLYIYNTANPLSDDRVGPEEQMRVRDLIYSRPPYPRLDALP